MGTILLSRMSMTVPPARVRTFHRLGVSRLAPVLAIALSAASAEASEFICDGSMRRADCSVADPSRWSASTAPTFTAQCQGCPTPIINDAGVLVTMCGPSMHADLRQFMISGPNMPLESRPLDFERVGSCGDRALFRYNGPLVAGTYEIWLNNNPHGRTVRFIVVDEAPDAGASGDAGTAGAGADAASAGGGEPTPVGCSSIAGQTHTGPSGAAGGLFLVAAIGAMALRSTRRRS